MIGPENENDWTFGQTVPLILLAAPLILFVENISSRSMKKHTANPDSEAPLSHSSISDTPSVAGEESRQPSIIEAYETKWSIRGTYCLAAMSYSLLAVCILMTENVGIDTPFREASLLFSVLHPGLQVTWILYALWIPKLRFRKSQQSFMLHGVFLVTLAIPIPQVRFPPYATHGAVQKFYIGPMAPLGMAYFILIGWFALDSRVRKGGTGSSPIRKQLYLNAIRVVTGVFIGAAGIAVSCWVSYVEYFHQFLSFEEAFLPTLGIVFGAQSLLQLFELWVTWKPDYEGGWVRGLVDFLASACFFASSFFFAGPRSFGMTMIAASMLVSVPLWTTFWLCYDLCRWWRKFRESYLLPISEEA